MGGEWKEGGQRLIVINKQHVVTASTIAEYFAIMC